MGKSQKSVKEFAMIGFILLAVLFGFQIMTFIFGNLSATDYLDDINTATINESGGWINETGYSIILSSQANFSGGAVITSIWNLSSADVIWPGNYTVNSATGNLTNSSTAWPYLVNLSYTTLHKTEAEMVSESVTNDSLRAIGDYSGQAGTQFTTLGIAITLILLVAVFLFFWQAFMGKGKGEGGPGSFS